MIPKKWIEKDLNEIVASLLSGTSVNGEDRELEEEEVAVLKVSAVTYGKFNPKAYKVVTNVQDQERLSISPKQDSIIISRANTLELVGASAYIDQNYPKLFLSDKLWQIQTTHECQAKWLSYVLATDEMRARISDCATGTSGSMKNISQKAFLSLSVKIPPLAEQRKIAEILGTWDAAIAKAERLVEALKQRKKALMQRLLTGEVRFPGFKDEWERKKIRDVFSRITDKNTIGSTNVLTASGQYGLVSQTEYFNRNVAGASLENYYLIYQGDFAYNRSSSDGYPFGAIKQLIQYELGIVSTLYICFRLSDTSSNIDFYRHYFEAGCLNRNIYSIAQEGARNHGLLNVGIDDFFNLELLVPCLEEQEIISTFFNNIDKNLQIAIEYYQKLLQQKRGLMQRLLSGEVRVSVESKAEELLPA